MINTNDDSPGSGRAETPAPPPVVALLCVVVALLAAILLCLAPDLVPYAIVLAATVVVWVVAKLALAILWAALQMAFPSLRDYPAQRAGRVMLWGGGFGVVAVGVIAYLHHL